MPLSSMPGHRGAFWLWALWVCLCPSWVSAHGGRPQITGFVFPSDAEVWALTDNQGIFAYDGDGVRWLCEDAIAPGAGLIDVAVVDAMDGRWLLQTAHGLFVTDDAGCTFTNSPSALADQTITGLSVHPQRPREVLATTATFDARNDIFRSLDRGRTWRPTGVGRAGRFLQLMRSRAEPERVYARQDVGLLTSANGGAVWSPLPVMLSGQLLEPATLRLLDAPAGPPGVLWLAVEAAPETVLLVTRDHGRNWTEALRIADLEVGIVFDADGLRGLVHSVFGGGYRTEDAGLTWVVAPLPVPRLTHVARGPSSDRLWGTSSRFAGGPWALAHSDDFGLTWQPALTDFEDVDVRWECPANTAAVACCAPLCPGLPPAAMCADQVLDGEFECLPPATAPDGGVPIDAAIPVDAGARDAAMLLADAHLDGGISPVDVQNPAQPTDGGLDAKAATEDQGMELGVERLDGTLFPRPDRALPRGDVGLMALSDAIIESSSRVTPAANSGGCQSEPSAPHAPIAPVFWGLVCGCVLVYCRRWAGRAR